MLPEIKFLHTNESSLKPRHYGRFENTNTTRKIRHGYMFDTVGKIPMRLEKIKMVDENALGGPRTRPRDHKMREKNDIQNKRKSRHE
jgi:hypothetical protein